VNIPASDSFFSASNLDLAVGFLAPSLDSKELMRFSSNEINDIWTAVFFVDFNKLMYFDVATNGLLVQVMNG
jgi:hypothetical protein